MRRNRKARVARAITAGALTLGLTGAAVVAANGSGAQERNTPGVFEISAYTDPTGEIGRCVGTTGTWDTRGADLAALENQLYWSPNCTWNAYAVVMGWLAYTYLLRLVPDAGEWRDDENWMFHSYRWITYVWEMIRLVENVHTRVFFTPIAW